MQTVTAFQLCKLVKDGSTTKMNIQVEVGQQMKAEVTIDGKNYYCNDFGIIKSVTSNGTCIIAETEVWTVGINPSNLLNS